ncbi:fused MFS/spermidine synthase [bacterium]|nr:fused MFS/spermidine synthase [bacterium]
MPVNLKPADAFLVETLDRYDLYHFRVSHLYVSGMTPFQQITIAETYNYGRVLALDGSIQSSEDDEAIYHEALVQPAMLLHPGPERVLVIGGGEGATLREVYYHRSVRQATMVDLDEAVVALCREHLPSWHKGSFDDPRTRLVIGDGRQFVEQDNEKYDVVVIDIVDMLEGGPAQLLYTRRFYELVRGRLSPGGIVVVQGLELSHMDAQQHGAVARTLRAVFPQVHSYRAPVGSFLSSWGFLLASDWADPWAVSSVEIDERLRERLAPLASIDHMDGQFFHSMFGLDLALKKELAKDGPMIEDDKPLVFPPNPDDPIFEDQWTAGPGLTAQVQRLQVG